ncbi:retinol dehydrogenase 12-like isoform X1 [Brienomyrus brachyistius]|uniref:retinol dehydrogenase 12-like isoform X1 n=2 Tax=Brienomyrus brachyistius TaxID=42636 RepID=UPI0020B2060B|nr:retinol dehydrogenase 12-like isoform X1 [Brienomyrus brachyistius]
MTKQGHNAVERLVNKEAGLYQPRTRRMWEGVNSSELEMYGVAALAVIGVVLLRNWLAGGVCRSKALLHGKTVLITGANTGIGKETARDLAGRGARVIMACRDLSRAERAADEIRQSTGNRNVVVRHLDLASLSSVRQFAKSYICSEERLDILINNAGVMMCPKSLTVDGYETQFAVNHLGHFLLTTLLLERLECCVPSRVITVSSMTHKGGKIHFEDLNFNETPYNPLTSYRQSKLANILFAKELAHRVKGSGVSSFSLHPGVIRTELGRHMGSRHPLLYCLLYLPAVILLKTPREGAQTSIYCAVAEDLEKKSGCYFSDCTVKEPAPEGKDDLVALKLWELSTQLVGYAKDK